MKLTHIFVALFIALLLFAAIDARADDGVRISLGHTVVNSEVTTGEFSYEYRGWELGAMLLGEGGTRNGDQDLTPVYSLSHLIRPSWRFLGATNYYRLGVSYVDGSPLVGHSNFRLGLGLEWEVVQLEYFHLSSAGINSVNSGIDGIQLRFLIPNQ